MSWRWADSSVPMTQIAVITRITATARRLPDHRVGRPVVERRRRAAPKLTPTSASEPMTSTPVIAIAQPPSQPAQGPIARVTQEKVVPQSWSTLLR